MLKTLLKTVDNYPIKINKKHLTKRESTSLSKFLSAPKKLA